MSGAPPGPTGAAPEPPLPALQEAHLDTALALRLLDDVARTAEVLEVTAKHAPRAHASAERLDIAAARRLLEEGAARGLRLRYRFEGAEWSDTLLAAPGGGWRLVRMVSPGRP